jgi:ribosomal protein S18 acetylase RimI-like enzyme
VGYIACVNMGMLAFVMDVAVHPALQGRGLGRMLLAAAMEGLRDDGFLLVGLAVSAQSPALHLYESLGFHAVQRGETAIWWYDRRQLVWQADR